MSINTNLDNLLTSNDLPTFCSGHSDVNEESIGYLIKQAQIALHRTINAKMAH